MPRKKATTAPEAELDREVSGWQQEAPNDLETSDPAGMTPEAFEDQADDAVLSREGEEQRASLAPDGEEGPPAEDREEAGAEDTSQKDARDPAPPEVHSLDQSEESLEPQAAGPEEPAETIQGEGPEEPGTPLQEADGERDAAREVMAIDLAAAPLPGEPGAPMDENTEGGAPLEGPVLAEEEPVLAEEGSEEPVKSDRQRFFELNFRELDRRLTPEERQEWNSIYASYRSRSALSGNIIGVDRLSLMVYNAETDEMEREDMYCAIVVPYRVRIVIPASEMWDDGMERPSFVLRNMVGARISFIVTKVDREGGFAIASRKRASRVNRLFYSRRPALQRRGARIQCQVLAVGPRRCLVECYGHDIDLTQREMRYTAIPDLRVEYHPGQELDCVVKGYDPETDALEISVKEVESNPFDGAELRHPVGSRRQATIAGKYGGGVFCNLTDGTVCMCNYSYQHQDSDFMVGDTVILVIQRHETQKRQIYGKILSKW